MGVKFAHALGAHTVLFTTSPGKVADGKRLGADEVVISSDADAMAAHAGSFDLIVDTVSADHGLDAYLALLKLDATMVLVGAPPKPQQVSSFSLFFPRRILTGSLIGGVAETQEMLDFCGTHDITCDIETIRIQDINAAYERMLKSSHTFNLLDARGAISVTERAAYIGRIRNLARAVAQSYLESRARLGLPMAPKEWAAEVLAQIEKKAD